ncbi:Staphyloferrin B transporter [Paenibacillus plantiphilus]|uniref:Staphyloferrin B transporter n=1 Tax=Paenibacillus plantiphilus TaxID=2905650 RepID=A0ABN8G5X3_9BACL|nr:Staphyloferrin B transporter [Paenibacillus plantiphilus]
MTVLWIGNFMVMGSVTMVTPFLTMYVQELGVQDPDEIAAWAGLIFAANFVTLFLFQPLWGSLADRYGRKLMLLRAGFGIAIIVGMMGFASSPWQLLALRFLSGVVSGFTPAATALVAANTPNERMGFAMGVLHSGNVSGMILGPLFGGLFAEWIGIRYSFFVTGAVTLAASILVALFVREKFQTASTVRNNEHSIYQGMRVLLNTKPLPTLFTISVVIQFALVSSLPLIPLFVEELQGGGGQLAFYVGLVISVMGVSNLIFSPLVGRWGDRIGFKPILAISLLGAGFAFLMQCFVWHYWQLLASRFLLGVFMGGLIPSVRALIKHYSPPGMESRAYSFDTSAVSFGSMLGPILAGGLSRYMGIRGIFFMTAILLFANFYWVRRSLLSRVSSISSLKG